MPTHLPSDLAVAGRRAPVAALAATTTAGYGILFYAYGVLLLPMQHDLGWSRTFLSGTFSAALITAALVTIPIGRWLDRHRPQGLFLVRSSVACLFVLAWGHARSRPFFAVTWIVLGSCQAVLFYDAAFTVLTKRFHGQERSRAVTTVTLMGGLASTIFAPLTAFLAHSFGWRRAVFVLATILAAVTWPSFLFGLRQPPGHRQESGPPERVGLTAGEATKTASTAPREAFRSRAFWLLTIAYLLSAVTTFGVAVHLVAFLHERGMPTGSAATVLGAVGLVQVLGRSTFIRLNARVTALQLATFVLIAKALGLLLLLVVPGFVGAAMFVVVYGSANGVSTLTRAMTLAELYGPEHYGSISAVIASISAAGGALAPFAVAVAAALVGAEAPVLGALVVLCVLAALANELVARPARTSFVSAGFAAMAAPEP